MLTQILIILTSIFVISSGQFGYTIFPTNNFNASISITGNSQLSWVDSGVAICNVVNDQIEVQICSDEQGGAIMVWRDCRNDEGGDIYAQKINSSGNVQWTTNGLVLNESSLIMQDPQLCPDGEGGAIMVWSAGVAMLEPNIYI